MLVARPVGLHVAFVCADLWSSSSASAKITPDDFYCASPFLFGPAGTSIKCKSVGTKEPPQTGVFAMEYIVRLQQQPLPRRAVQSQGGCNRSP